MKKILSAVVMGICLSLLSAATVHANADCQFVLGFQTLRDLIGHEIVGECLENEHYNAIGDSVQQTTGGLLAWRKADNWTAFTDGYRTWVNGPNGLQQRLNTERFEWEADYAQFAAPADTTALTRDALRNAEYQTGLFTESALVFHDALVRLRDGAYRSVYRYEYDGKAREQAISLSLREEIQYFAFGDLNGDGIDDAAVIAGVYQGGNSIYSYLTVALNENGVPKHVASNFLGLKFGLESVTIENETITLRTRELASDDPNCCPTQELTRKYQLTEETLQLISEVPPRATPTPASPSADCACVEQLSESRRDHIPSISL